MSQVKHYPPSRIKYNEGHPTISVRVSRELYLRLQELKRLSGKTVGDVVREAMQTQGASAKASYQRGHKAGFAAAEQQYRVDYHCSVCGGTLTLESATAKQAAARYMREHGWRHNKCN